MQLFWHRRGLRAEAFVHNRVRMIVASFLTKDLLLDWREGYDHFRERYDPDAEYITEYVPELRGVPAEKIHAWTELDDDERESLAPDYPTPIVDHGERREEAIEMFERARGDD